MTDPIVCMTTVSAVAAAVPSLVTAMTAARQANETKKHAAKQSILQMIMEDRMRVELYKKPPENYQAIMKEFDVYTKAGGNSYVHDRVIAYEEWYKALMVAKDK